MPGANFRHGHRIALAILLGWGLTASSLPTLGAPAAADVSEPFAKRIVKVFDFNEKPLGNLEEIPMNWDKVTLSGFPHYVNGGFDYQVGCPPPSFCLQLNGGNLGYVFSERLIPAFPGSDHKIMAWVKTDKMRHARGYLKAFYIDRLGNFLSDTIRYTPLIEPAKPADPEWRAITLELPFTNPDGRFIGLGVFLVQQDQLPPEYSEPLKSFRKDLDAALWVDRIIVLRLPKVRLHLPQNTTLYPSGQDIQIQATVADVKTNDLSAQIILSDLAENRVKTFPHPVAPLPSLEAILNGQATQPELVPRNLGTLQPGLYSLDLRVLSDSKVIVDKRVKLAVLAHKRTGTEFNDFGLDLSGASLREPARVADFAGTLKPAWIVVPLWRKDLAVSRTNSDPSLADQLISEINHRGIPVIGSFPTLPESLAQRMNIPNPTLWDLLAANPAGFRAELSILLSRHADRIDQWVFGTAPDCWQSPDPRIDPVLKNLRKEFSQFQGEFSLIPSWPAMITNANDPPQDGWFIKIPSELVPGSFDEFFKPWRNADDKVWVTLQSQDLNEFQLQPALVDFVRRFVQAKCCRAKFIAAQELWTSDNPIAPDGYEPNAYYVAYANLIDRLGGMEYLGKIQIAPEREGRLFAGPERAVLVLDDPRPSDYRGWISLGEQVKAYDLWGRPLPLRIETDGWRVPYQPIVFLDGIDAELARFIASIRFDPASLSGKFGAQQIQLIFTNTFTQSISGLVRLSGPPFWQFDPSGAKFVLTAGKEFAFPVKLRFATNESIGQKSISLKFDLEARKPVHINLTVPLTLGAGDLDMRVLWFLRGSELVISQEVLNRGAGWVDLIAFTIVPDAPRMERAIRQLGPGKTAVKEYSLGPWQKMFGKSIRIGFREVRGTRLVNELITLE